MEAMDAHALFDIVDGVVTLCPYCESIHIHLKDPGRLVDVPAPCDETRAYKISKTLQPKVLVSSLRLHQYELGRKRKAYARRKAKESSDNPESENEPRALDTHLTD